MGGERSTFAWDSSGLTLQYDTLQLVFMKPRPEKDYGDHADSLRQLDYLGWFTEDLHATCDRLKANGVTFPKEALGKRPNPPPPGGPRTPAFAEDPCGIWFELVGVPQGALEQAKVDRWK